MTDQFYVEQLVARIAELRARIVELESRHSVPVSEFAGAAMEVFKEVATEARRASCEQDRLEAGSDLAKLLGNCDRFMHMMIAELESRPDFEGKPCSFCGEMTDNLAGSPGMWPLVFPDPGSKGRTSHHHVKCVMDRLSRPDPPALMAIVDVQRERIRQVSEEGWTTDHDDAHVRGELALAAVVYAVCDLSGASETVLGLWPWSTESLKASDRRRNLVRAAALIVAEIERVDRALDGKFSRKTAKPAAIDPDMPRRFRFHKCEITGFGQKFGLYIPSSGRVIAEDGSRFVGMPDESDFEGLEWIDAPPAPKEAGDGI